MLLVVFFGLLLGTVSLWAAGLPGWLVLLSALGAWITFYVALLPKLREFHATMGIDDKLNALESKGFKWAKLKLAGLATVGLAFVTSMVPFLGGAANWLEGKDLGVFFGPERGPRMTFYVGVAVFLVPFVLSWLHLDGLKKAAETEPQV